jgi:hypothetical protein
MTGLRSVRADPAKGSPSPGFMLALVGAALIVGLLLRAALSVP